MKLFLNTILFLCLSCFCFAQTPTKEEKIIQLEKEWTELLNKKDTTALSNIFTKDYVVNNAMGKIVGVKDIFKLLKAGHVFPRVDRNIEKITFNHNLAIVMGGEIEYGENNVKKHRRFTNVWVETEVGWKLIARQATGS